MSYSSHYQQSCDASRLASLCTTLSLEPRRAAAAADEGAAVDPTRPVAHWAMRVRLLRDTRYSDFDPAVDGAAAAPTAPAAPPAQLTDLLLIKVRGAVPLCPHARHCAHTPQQYIYSSRSSSSSNTSRSPPRPWPVPRVRSVAQTRPPRLASRTRIYCSPQSRAGARLPPRGAPLPVVCTT
ncbi:hypothetical protein E2C01_063689 [Portunus trituberculatus]|uniref:Uncharacterized protein n=1 Tax=Portunus trituberculatus TaxID=210409 RepID=A0A5B7HLL1_PORTR|nr:hypothetical protein [Portunus trituberculatus]